MAMKELLHPERLLEILEGNRRLTLRTVETFSEENLFQYTPATPLRPFAEMVKEIIGIEDGYVRGIATGEWTMTQGLEKIATKDELMAALKAVRARTLELWPKVTVERLLTEEVDGFFGDWPQPNLDRLIYALENEIHHRGQGFTYLRLLGQEPPAFYER